jgi:hypothetical protein
MVSIAGHRNFAPDAPEQRLLFSEPVRARGFFELAQLRDHLGLDVLGSLLLFA